MIFRELVKERYSVRRYSKRQVEEEKLQVILEAGRLSPTAANLQPQKIYVLKTEAAMEKARSATKMMYNAPMALLVCYDDTVSWKGTAFGDSDYDGGEVDAAIVTTTMMMETAEAGLGSLWVRGFCARRVSEAFELPEKIHPVCFLLLGYPDESSQPTKNHELRKELGETVTVL